MVIKKKKTEPVTEQEPKYKKWAGWVGLFVAVCVSIGFISGAWSKYDNRYPKIAVVEEMKKMDARLYAENKYTSDRLDVKIMQDRRNELDSRVYKIQSSPAASAPEMKEATKQYQEEIKELDKAIDTKQKQMVAPEK
jgi:seryl-tRNA synthetase